MRGQNDGDFAGCGGRREPRRTAPHGGGQIGQIGIRTCQRLPPGKQGRGKRIPCKALTGFPSKVNVSGLVRFTRPPVARRAICGAGVLLKTPINHFPSLRVVPWLWLGPPMLGPTQKILQFA